MPRPLPSLAPRRAAPPNPLSLLALEARWNPVRFDFRFDDDASHAGPAFFDSAAKVQALQDAGKAVGGLLGDSLTAIAPNPGVNDTWAAQYVNPATGGVAQRANLTVPADVLVVYVGGRAGLTSDGGVAFASPGSATAVTGSEPFRDGVQARGQAGALVVTGKATDFGPWGGSVSFDTTTNWYFGTDPAGAAPGQVDFRTTAMHELGHVLGYGTSSSWFASLSQYASNGNWYFVGDASVKAYGGQAVPTENADFSGAHWARGVRSPQDDAPAIMNGDPADRQPRAFTVLDRAGLRDIGWEVSVPDAKSPVGSPPVPLAPPTVAPPSPPVAPPPTAPTVPPDAPPVSPPIAPATPLPSEQLTVISPDAGRLGTVTAYGPNGVLRAEFTPYGAFTGGVRTASAAVDGDGYADIVTAPGPGLAAQLRVYSGADGHLMRSWLAFEEGFTGGAFVAAGDLTGDGYTDIVTSPDAGGGPRVRVFDGKSGLVVADFFGIDDPAFRGGCRIALGDINGDGVPDLVVSAGAGGGPRVAIFDGAALGRGRVVKLVTDFFIFEPVLRDGVFVSVGDIDRDGRGDLVVGAGPGGAPRVFIASGVGLLDPAGVTLIPVANFFAGDTANRGGVRVAVKQLANDAGTELVVAPGKSAGSAVTRYTYTELTKSADPTPESSRRAYEAGFNGGVFVG